MSNQNTPSNAGIGVPGLLGVLFVGLKLTGYISWPWIWVLSPFWIPIAIIVPIVLVFAIFCGIGKD